MAVATLTCTIPAGQTVSNKVNIQAQDTPVMVIMPSDWHPTTEKVVLSFQISIDGTNFFDVYQADGTEMTTPVVPGAGMVMFKDMTWVPTIRLRSGSYSNPVPVEADRTFKIITA